MDYHKKASFWLILSYLGFLLYKQTPSVPDSIILIALAAIFGYESFLSSRPQAERDDEVWQLERELHMEQLKLRTHEVKKEYMRKSVNNITAGQGNERKAIW